MVNKLFLIPLLLALYLPITFFITYGIAVGLKHVYPWFPYISDTGTISPESCIFGQLLNIYAVIAMLFMIVRYSQIRQHYRVTDELGGPTPEGRKKLIVNKICLVIGLLADLGASMVGNFQEDNVIQVHMLGAFMAFGFGGLYSWIQTILSYQIPNLKGSTLFLRHTRLIFCIAFTTSFLLMISFTSISMKVLTGNIKHWQPGEPGYNEHLVATITEWLLAIIQSLWFITFVTEFREIGLKANVVQIHVDNDERTLM